MKHCTWLTLGITFLLAVNILSQNSFDQHARNQVTVAAVRNSEMMGEKLQPMNERTISSLAKIKDLIKH